jgi:LAO/AO transport system kinase
VSELADAVRAGDRRALARAITLIESTRADHEVEAAALVDELLPYAGGAARLAISGAPGAGKSTFIEAFGTRLIDAGHAVAVLAVDPSSSRSGGSILGDKTRMEELSRQPAAFVRPSPTGGTLGGVARRTREAGLLCEAAGFDVVIVETVGVGQSEVAVADMVDCFILLVAPGGGDELQGIKRGIMELADIVVVTKADGSLAAAANQAVADYRSALHLIRPKHHGWNVPVLACSAVKGEGIGEVWDAVQEHHDALASTGALDRLRSEQARAWMWSEVTDALVQDLRREPGLTETLKALEAKVVAGECGARSAAITALRARTSDGSAAT